MSVFNFTAEYGSNQSRKPRVSTVSFGDGYAQRIPHGANNNPQSWQLNFANREPAEGDAIIAFFVARGGSESFDWTPPLQAVALKFVCQEWTLTPEKAGRVSISAKFEQVFDL